MRRRRTVAAPPKTTKRTTASHSDPDCAGTPSEGGVPRSEAGRHLSPRERRTPPSRERGRRSGKERKMKLSLGSNCKVERSYLKYEARGDAAHPSNEGFQARERLLGATHHFTPCRWV